MMRIEAEAKVGATKGKHTRERTTYFSGARARRIDMRLGTVYLLVPKASKDGHVQFFISERRRSEQALIAVVQEAFVNGVSIRKIERLARAMGIDLNSITARRPQREKGFPQMLYIQLINERERGVRNAEVGSSSLLPSTILV